MVMRRIINTASQARTKVSSSGILFLIAFVSLIGANMMFASYSVDHLLRSEAKNTAERWANRLSDEFPNLAQVAEKRSIEPEELARLRAIVFGGDVFLFKLFDRRGDLVLSSAALDHPVSTLANLNEHNAIAFRTIKSGEAFVSIQSGAGKPNRPDHYAEAYVPLLENGATVATVEVYVDQKDRFVLYHQHGRLAAVIIGLFSAAAFALPALLAVVKSRQKLLADRRIHFLARHDGLTEVTNRAEFNRILDDILALDDTATSGLLCLDLDNFKPVNDTLGHDAGDELLRQVAQRLKSYTRDQDTVARLGGDEFAVLCGPIKTAVDCEDLAIRLIDAMKEPFFILGHTVQIGTSVGIALLPKDGRAAAEALKAADIALYRAKADGRGTYRFFEPGMDEDLKRRRNLESDLRWALRAGQFELYYQAQYDLLTSATTGYEALLRWQHPERGMVSPAEFIPLAEETTLIQPIGKWVLQQACKHAAGWPSHLHVSVNVSAVQLRSPRIVAEVSEALRDSGLEPHRLELEITESAILNQSQHALAILLELKSLGVRISMDDFGTGYSSLSYLQRFPFDKIKIDKSFVSSLGQCHESTAIVRAVIGLGASLGKTTTAEGVETIEQLELLRREGCSEIQGYYIARPKPAKDIENTPSKAVSQAVAA